MLLERKWWLGRRVKDMLLLYFLNSVSTEKHLQSQKNPNKKPRREELQKLGNVLPIIFPSIDSASYFNFFLYKPFINKDWFFPHLSSTDFEAEAYDYSLWEAYRSWFSSH